MTSQQKLLTALLRQARKSKNPKLVEKIKKIKQKKSLYDWLAQ